MVRVCVDDPILDENGEFTGYYRLAGPNCPEVSVRTYAYLNLERPSVGGAWAEDSQYFYSAYLAAAGTSACTVHGEGGLVVDPNDRRSVRVVPTEEGGAMKDDVLRLIEELNIDILSGFTAEQRATLISCLQQISKMDEPI